MDLRRSDPAAAATYAAAGLGTAGPRDGALFVVTDEVVHVLPLPIDPADLARHVAAELATPVPRPTVALLRSAAEPALAAGRRVRGLRVPPALAAEAIREWSGPEIADAALAAAEAQRRWRASRPDTGDVDAFLDWGAARPPEGSAHAGPVRVTAAAFLDEDTVEVAAGRSHLDRGAAVALLAANPDWAGPVSSAAQEMYARLRASGMARDDALAVLPGVLARLSDQPQDDKPAAGPARWCARDSPPACAAPGYVVRGR